MPEPDSLLTQEETMLQTGLSQWALTKLVLEGRLRRYRRVDGSRAYYSASEIEAFKRSCPPISRSCYPIAGAVAA